MELAVNGRTKVKYVVNVKVFLIKFKPKLLSDFTCRFDTFLISNVKFLKFNNLCQINLQV